MHKTILTILFSILATGVFSQISVATFERIDNDLTARVDHPVRDQNGDVSALIKVETTQTGFHFEGCGLGIVTTEQKIGEIWVYIPFGARRLTIHHPQLGTLRNYVYPLSIERATVYVMKLTTARVTTIIEEPEIQTEWVVIKSEPEGAQVFINDRPVGRTPYSGEFNLGRHNYRLELPMYHSEAGTFTLSKDAGRHDIDLKLRPAFGSISIYSEPESGAEVLLNNRPTGQTTPCTLSEIESGTHTITIKKDMYYDAWQEVTVEDNKTTQVNLKMNPAYGVLKIYTSPEADIYINAQKEGHGTHTVRKLTGFYNIEAKKDKHTPASRRVEVKDGEEIIVNLNPTPQYGQLRIATTPPDAEIFLDGKRMGITPVTLREVLIGDYRLELRKTGYASHTQNITIKHNETTNINETLSDGMEITITSTPSGAKIEIDGKDMGKTPFKGMLGFGSHDIKITNNKKVVTERINVTQGEKTSWEFDMRDDKGTFTDSRDNKTYNTVKIGNQTWMAENLNYNTSSGSWCYNNSNDNCNKYGRLYDWETAKTVCPTGWKLPSKTDFETLLNNVGGSGSNAYKALMPSGSSGFSALFGGWRYSTGLFINIGSSGYFWSSSPNDSDSAWSLNVLSYFKNANVYYNNRSVGFSVRCIKD